jgi:LmbE family N-acetylglucosaminyl deacetylase
MSYLIVAAHPDDEVLGAGGMMCKLSGLGKEVNVCILSSRAEARRFRPDGEGLSRDTEESMRMLGVNQAVYGDFPNIQLNTVPHLELVQFIEDAILKTNADVIVTHHPSDLNNDHVHASLACQAAARLFQRREDVAPLKELLFMEVPSATEWALNSAEKRFSPNVFVEIGKKCLSKKIEALSLYRGVMRDYPHPRCREVLEGLAAYRGGQAGLVYAEAFESVFRRLG